jgi:hypothetical protein
VCSKKKKSDKNAEKKQKKDLTGPTLLEISEYATYRALTACCKAAGKLYVQSNNDLEVQIAVSV